MKTCSYSVGVLLLLLLLTTGCGCDQQGPEIFNLFAKQDSTPPKLLSAKATDTATITFIFDEVLANKHITIKVAGISSTNFLQKRETVTLYLPSAMEIGSSIRIEGRVEDLWGNSTCFSLDVWANNPSRAELMINEFSTKGSATNPDRVELFVTKGGNLAGITVAHGVGPYASDQCILPNKEVYAGDFVVIAFQPSDSQSEFQSEYLSGLSSNNGCITISESPNWESPVLDAVVYSNKTTTTYGGFGSKNTELVVQQLYQCGQWFSPLAEQAIDSTSSTATRTMCRRAYTDTNSELDWYICATKEASFGSENSTTEFEATL